MSLIEFEDRIGPRGQVNLYPRYDRGKNACGRERYFLKLRIKFYDLSAHHRLRFTLEPKFDPPCVGNWQGEEKIESLVRFTLSLPSNYVPDTAIKKRCDLNYQVSEGRTHQLVLPGCCSLPEVVT